MESLSEPNRTANGQRLKGWKEIAAALCVHPRTLQRWVEHGVNVPVHRIRAEHGSIVYADRSELEAWIRTAKGREVAGDNGHVVDGQSSGRDDNQTAPTTLATTPGRRRAMTIVAVGVILVSLVVALPFVYTRVFSTTPTATTGNPVTSVALLLTFLDGTKHRVGVSVERPATIGVQDKTFVLSVQVVADGVLLRVSGVGDARGDGGTELAAVVIKKGDKVNLTQSSDIKTIEWLAERSQPSATSHPSR